MAKGDVETGESQPLLAVSEPPPLQEMKAESLKEKAVASVAGVGFLTSLISVLWQATAHPTVWISGILGMVLTPYSVIQQRKLTQLEALYQTNEFLEQEVSQLEKENLRLSQASQQLQEQVLNLQTMQETLEALDSMQTSSMDELEQQLKTSQEILQSMDLNWKTEVLQNIIVMIASSDRNQDMTLADDEIDELLDRLESIHGIQLQHEQIRSLIIQQGRDIRAVMELCRQVMSDDENTFVQYIKQDEE